MQKPISITGSHYSKPYIQVSKRRNLEPRRSNVSSRSAMSNTFNVVPVNGMKLEGNVLRERTPKNTIQNSKRNGKSPIQIKG